MKTIWLIYGADQNVDFGGPHTTPLLGVFLGTQAEAEAYAKTRPECVTPYTKDDFGGRVEKAAILRPRRKRG